jgi:hypothetical protein
MATKIRNADRKNSTLETFDRTFIRAMKRREIAATQESRLRIAQLGIIEVSGECHPMQPRSVGRRLGMAQEADAARYLLFTPRSLIVAYSLGVSRQVISIAIISH